MAPLFCGIHPAALQHRAQTYVSPTDDPLLLTRCQQALPTDPWEFGAFLQGGLGTGDRSRLHLSLRRSARSARLSPTSILPGILRGQFEYAVEIMPYWQSFTPAPHIALTKYIFDGQIGYASCPTAEEPSPASASRRSSSAGISAPARHFVPWLQGAGGFIYTTHKYPPDILVPHGQPGGTSVFNFTPQFGIGFHYFVKPRRSIDFAANAIHISSASLGDRNPGVNASVQFQIGYTWWK